MTAQQAMSGGLKAGVDGHKFKQNQQINGDLDQ